MDCVYCLTHITEYVIIKISGQGLPAELGKYIWLPKADTSQEAPASKSGSSSRLEENSFVLDFIIKNKKHFLADKFYNSRMKEYDIIDEKIRQENEKNKKENKPIVIYCERKRKGTNRYMREIIMETFYYGKDLNIRDIVKRIAICSSFNELGKLHTELETKSEMMI